MVNGKLKFGRIITTTLKPNQKFFITDILKTKVKARRVIERGLLSNFIFSFPKKTVKVIGR